MTSNFRLAPSASSKTWLPLLAGLVLATGSLAAAPDETQRPYCRLYGIGYASADLPDEQARNIAAYFTFIEGVFTPEQIVRIKKYNPGIKIIRYLNSSYTAQYLASLSGASNYMEDEARNLEDGHKLDISMFLAATLVDDLNADATIVRLSPASPTLCLRASTIEGSLSRDTHGYVSWIQIGNELMRLESVDGKRNTVRVTRGLDGTRKAPHATGAKVFAPIYIGTGENENAGRAGASGRNKLRYAYEPNSTFLYEVKAKQVMRLMEQGYDGSKFDIMGLNFFNQADAFGNKVVPWDFGRGAPFTAAAMLEAQQRKVAFVQEYVHRQTGRFPVIVGNGGGEFFGDHHDHGGTMSYVVSTAVKPRPLDGLQLENFVSVPHRGRFGNPNPSANRVIHAARHNLPTISLLTFEHVVLGRNNPDVIQHEYYGYACHLLGWEPGTAPLCSAPVFRDSPDGKGQVVALLPFYLYDLGRPKQSFDHVAAYETPAKGVYRREFTKGLVLVNATDAAVPDVALGQEYFDPGEKRNVATISLPAHTGKILLGSQP